MKAGILTIHDCYNYGAVLQASATLELLKEQGIESEIIDYATPDLVASNRFIKLPFSKRAVLDDIRNLINSKEWHLRSLRFKDYKEKYYSLSSKKLRSPNDLRIIKDDYDMFITGSDQTFNLHLMGSPMYRFPFFLDFTNKKKISLASSMGDSISSLSFAEKDHIKKSLMKYNSISVRDLKSSDFLGKLLDKKIPMVSDPTICVDVDFWNKMLNTHNRKKYIFFYSVVSAPWVVQKVCEIGRALNMPIVSPHMPNRFEMGKRIIRRTDSGPIEFLNLLNQAALVVTTSFHATVFSLLFHIPFYAFHLGEGNRIGSLLNQVKMSELFLSEKCITDNVSIPRINYSPIDHYFASERKKARLFLNHAIIGGINATDM